MSEVDAARRRHQQLGIPEDISRETLSLFDHAIAISRWNRLRLTGELYQVGRLEVTPYRLLAHPEAGPLFWYDAAEIARLGPGFRRGDPALGLHVPASEPLTPAMCDDSIHRIRTAFGGVFPGEPLRIATCTSWLLDEQLAEYLPADSNIVGFERRFNMVPGARDNDDAILHAVFGPDRPTDIEALPRRTSLERAVVDHLRAGKHWRVRTGWIDIKS